MRRFCTEFKAICVKTGSLETFIGDHVAAPSWKLAQEWCDKHAGHLKIVGELICEGSFDYQKPQLN